MNTLIDAPAFKSSPSPRLAAVVFVGFAKTYYLKPLFDTPPLRWRPTARDHRDRLGCPALHPGAAGRGHRVDIHRVLGSLRRAWPACSPCRLPPWRSGTPRRGMRPGSRSVAVPVRAPRHDHDVYVVRRERARASSQTRMAQATDAAWNDDLARARDGRLDAQVMAPLGQPRLVLAPAVTFGFVAWAWRTRLAPARARASCLRRGRHSAARFHPAQTRDWIHGHVAADRSLDRRVTTRRRH